MKQQKLDRGAYGYLKQKQQTALLGTIAMVLLGIGIFVVGLLLNKMEIANIFTVAAVCMVLPAAKYFVTVVILFPYHAMEFETKQRLDSYARATDTILYDVVFTSSEKVMHLDCIYVTGHQIIGYTSRKKDKVQTIQEYLKKELSLREIPFTVCIVTEEKQVKDRMKLRGKETEENETQKQEVLELLRVFTV